jgi:hypothetical protein
MAETSGRPVLVSQINRFSGYAYSAADLVHDDDDLVCYSTSRSDPVSKTAHRVGHVQKGKDELGTQRRG